jgi:RHS repeat-associated protein
LFTFTRGKKLFELTNHLGNVLATVSDKKFGTPTTGIPSQISYYTADVKSAQDYYPFGMEMPGRQYNATYPYSFNGKRDDKDAEYGWQDYGKREYDRLSVHFISVDPITAKYPMLTPYQFAGNKPIAASDLDGLETYIQTVHNALLQKAEQGLPTAEAEKKKIQAISQRIMSNTSVLSQVKPSTPVEDYKQTQYRIQQNRNLGYNDDGSEPPLMRLGKNKTWNYFSENVGLPLVENLAFDGLGKLAFSSAAKFETFYRAMSNEEFAIFSKSGKLPVGGEKFISTQMEYSQKYIGKPGYEVLVEFNTKEGTLKQLANIGVRDNSKMVIQNGFGNLPKVSKGWQPTNALFKGEGSTLNIGLGSGSALSIFNKNIVGFKIVGR